ncbi:ECF-type sigma factor [Myxococcus landrumensis]|uniref:RNA polymerase n=1 Tax=Myxococcus landrumensis TaxID=2813577 RepID=A0ABX7MXT1_9BACT|nr:ECF-type sigma factor [Myxococcus landrumus]QSQ11216.1 RNA polymerase [Myxococcus landrumus]
MSTAELTILLAGVRDGDASARDALMAATYQELRLMALAVEPDEGPHPSLQPAALVREAWTRLLEDGAALQDRGPFFRAAARAIRRVLVDRTRARVLQRSGARHERVSLHPPDEESPASLELDVLRLEEVLVELESFQPRLARWVELRYFTGLSLAEAANALDVSQATASRDWSYVRTWLTEQLSH